MKNPKRFYVYCYAEPGKSHPFYIGKGRGDRAYTHLRPSFLARKSHFYCKLRGMLQKGITPRIEFLAVGLAEVDALALEVALIEKWGRRDVGSGVLCNATIGGDGVLGLSGETREKIASALRGRPLAPETKAKMSASHMGRQPTDATRKKLSGSLKGRHLTDEWRAKISAAHLGKVLSSETRERIGIAGAGRKHSTEARVNMSEAQRLSKGRSVQSTDPRTGAVKVYEIVSDVVKDGFSQGNVSECCKGNRVTHKGLLWHYCDQPIVRDAAREQVAASNNHRAGRSVQSTDPVTGEVKRYAFMSDVKRDGFSQGNVGMCCKGQRPRHKGLLWSFCPDEPRPGPDDRGESRLGTGPEVGHDVQPLG